MNHFLHYIPIPLRSKENPFKQRFTSFFHIKNRHYYYLSNKILNFLFKFQNFYNFLTYCFPFKLKKPLFKHCLFFGRNLHSHLYSQERNYKTEFHWNNLNFKKFGLHFLLDLMSLFQIIRSYLIDSYLSVHQH